MIAGRSAERRSSTARSRASPSLAGRSAGSGSDAGSGEGLALHEHLVEREVDEGRTGRRLQGGVQGLVDQSRDLGRGVRGARLLGDRRDERNVVDLLERSL